MSSTELTLDLQDLQFALLECLKIGELSKYPVFQDFDEETIAFMLKEGVEFATQVMAPTMSESDRIGTKIVDGRAIVPECIHEVYKKAYELGWANMIAAPKWGGQGVPRVLYTAIQKAHASSNFAASAVWGLTMGTMGLIESFGSEELQQKFIPQMVNGTFSGTMCLSEPHAGSDVGASLSSAEPLGDGSYRIKGTKCWITNGDTNLSKNVIHAVLARIKGAPEGTKGLSLFLVPAFKVNEDGSVGEHNDVALGSIEHKMGFHASPTCVMNFGENDRCVGYLLGEENQGMAQMFQMMNDARIGTAVVGLAGGAAAYQYALDYAKERVQGTHINELKNKEAKRVAIIEHPDVRLNLINMKARVEAMRALLYATAKYIDLESVVEDEQEKQEISELIGLLTPMCKAWLTEVGLDVASCGIQVLGGVGYTKDFPIEQIYRDIRVATIYEGTTGIQALDLVGRKMTARNGEPFMNLLKRFQELIDTHKHNPALASSIELFGNTCEQVAESAMTMQSMFGDRGVAGAVLYATPFLMFVSAVTAGYYFLQQGVVAFEKLETLKKEHQVTDQNDASFLQSNSKARFYDTKLKTIRFYMSVVLPTFEANAVLIKRKNYDALDIPL